jgi:ribosomal protein S27AE
MDKWVAIAKDSDRWFCPNCKVEVVDHTGDEVEDHTEHCPNCGQEYEVVVC